MEERLEIRDFSKGMNRDESIASGDAPWDLTDVILDDSPEIKRRGLVRIVRRRYQQEGGSVVWQHATVPGYVIHAKRYTFGGNRQMLLCVSVSDGKTKLYMRETVQDNTIHKDLSYSVASFGNDSWFEIFDGEDTIGATVADSCVGLTPDNLSDKFTIIVTTNIATWAISFNQSAPFPDFIIKRIAFYNPPEPGYSELNRKGFVSCQTVGAYSFLGGDNLGETGRRLYWSKLDDSTSWKNNTTSSAPQNGGSVELSLASDITSLKQLENNLVIFTKESISFLTVSADQNNWTFRKRINEGTNLYKTIQEYKDGFVFANQKGVYFYSGYELTSLTQGSIDSFYQNWIYKNEPASVSAYINGDYLVLINNIIVNNEVAFEALCCYLPTLSWTRFTSMNIACVSHGFVDDQFYGYRHFYENNQAKTYIMSLDYLLHPDNDIYAYNIAPNLINNQGVISSQYHPGFIPNGPPLFKDELGGGPKMSIQLRRLNPNGLSKQKLWKTLSVHYDSTIATTYTGPVNIFENKTFIKEPSHSYLDVEYTTLPDKDDVVWTNLGKLNKFSYFDISLFSGTEASLFEGNKPINRRWSGIEDTLFPYSFSSIGAPQNPLPYNIYNYLPLLNKNGVKIDRKPINKSSSSIGIKITEKNHMESYKNFEQRIGETFANFDNFVDETYAARSLDPNSNRFFAIYCDLTHDSYNNLWAITQTKPIPFQTTSFDDSLDVCERVPEIVKFNKHGEVDFSYSSQWPDYPSLSSEDKFIRPSCIQIARPSNSSFSSAIYLLTNFVKTPITVDSYTAQDRIAIFNQDGKYLSHFNIDLINGTPETSRFCLDDSEEPEIFTIGNNRFRKYSSTGTLLFDKGGYGSNNGQFNEPSDIVFNANTQEVLVLDAGNGRVQVFDTNGNFIRSMFSQGTGTNQLNTPLNTNVKYTMQIRESNDRLYITDKSPSPFLSDIPRIRVFTYEGSSITGLQDQEIYFSNFYGNSRFSVDKHFGNIFLNETFLEGSFISNQYIPYLSYIKKLNSDHRTQGIAKCNILAMELSYKTMRQDRDDAK